MEKQTKKEVAIERVVVPGSKKNNKVIYELIEQKTSPQIRNFIYRGTQYSGFLIDLEQTKIIANTILEDPDQLRALKIYSKDKNGYHLHKSKDFREITDRTNHIIDLRLKKSIRQIKESLPKKVLA